ncbi:ornithine cyclodeaminase family protein [Oceanobacillus sp. FSL K6-2867]|uniref:ornithine cyclodeaminase family protein n=1 Tax=Oceanobacillus sp. FSL K6-2867 TaxID=2954748 RepID=UPI0030D9F080
MLILSENDVNQSLSMKEAIDVMQQAFVTYAKQDYIMPERMFSQVKEEDTFLLMPCYVDDCIGLKVVTSFPSNNGRDEPVTQGVIMINDRETGKNLSLMNGTLLTAIKTAAVSGVAMRYFKKEAKTIGLIGTGLQGLYQLLAAIESTNVEQIYVYNRTPEKIESFKKDFYKLTNQTVEVVAVNSVEQLIQNSEIIITATTSLSPVIPNDASLYTGKLVVGVGSYKENMRELPEELFKCTPYYVIDSEDGKKECGDIIDPIQNGWIDQNNVVLLSDLIIGNKKYDASSDKPIVFKTVSMALFDALIGNYVYKKAQEQNIGVVVEI